MARPRPSPARRPQPKGWEGKLRHGTATGLTAEPGTGLRPGPDQSGSGKQARPFSYTISRQPRSLEGGGWRSRDVLQLPRLRGQLLPWPGQGGGTTAPPILPQFWHSYGGAQIGPRVLLVPVCEPLLRELKDVSVLVPAGAERQCGAGLGDQESPPSRPGL